VAEVPIRGVVQKTRLRLAPHGGVRKAPHGRHSCGEVDMLDPQHQPTLMDASRSADPELQAAPAGSDHTVQFYEDEAFLQENVARYLGAGLIADEPVLVIATEPHRRAFQESLAAKGFDVERASAAGRLSFLDARATLDAFMVGGMPEWERFRSVVGGTIDDCLAACERKRVCLYGEMVDVLWRDGNPQAAIRLEEFWNDLGRARPFSLHCAYAMGNFFKEAHCEPFERICKAHDHVVPGESYLESDERDKRLREISLLQQRARALETELQRRKELEEALRYAREQAEAASTAKDEFLAMLGHELRNPLSPILTALELMKLRGDGQISREQEVIDRQTRHLIRLVDDLLDVSRITRGKVELRKQPVEVRDILAKATEIASPLLEQRRHHFDVHAPPRGVRLEADEARVAQVVANLLTNAAKYTEQGGHISLSARRNGAQVVIEVRDNGIGIAPGLLPRIFDLFVQGRQASDRAEGGLGIGLALVRNLVTMHGGTVEARSPGLGKGSIFTVRLPALDGARGAEVPAPASLGLLGSQSTRRRILVVDDNEDARMLLGDILESAGHEVCAAESGPAALAIVEEFSPDVAVLDVGLPAMDGYELGSRLRALLGPRAPTLVALTGYGQEADRARSESSGFKAHLVKPLEASQLIAEIDRCVEASR
jgi:signal transduction histidine kinase/ActR/RegA family two-component response regulator